MTEKRVCLVIAPIGAPGSDTRRRSEIVFMEIIKPAAIRCGYSVVHPREVMPPGLITPSIIRHVVSAPLVIADLTGGNPNVFYELALRHAVRKPVVQIVMSGQEIPFNVMDTRTISFDIEDVDSRKSTVEEIVSQIRDIESDASPLETPVSIADINIWTSFHDVEKTLPTTEASSLVIRHREDLMQSLQTLTPADAIPIMWGYIEDLKKNPRVNLLEAAVDDLDAACTLVERVPKGGYISQTSSLQDHDSDERMAYRTAVNRALEANVTYRKVICSSPELLPERHRKWLEEITDKAILIKEGRVNPEVFRLLHYPVPMSVDVLISQDSDGEVMEMVAGFAGAGGVRGGFYTNDKRMVENWLDVYLEKKIIPVAEQHTKAVLEGAEECACLQFLKLLDDARQQAPQPKPVLRNTSPKRKAKSLIR